MTDLATLLDTLQTVGLSVQLGANGQPKVVGPKANVTPEIMAALKRLRNEVLVSLGAKLRQWLWWDGRMETETPEDVEFLKGEPLSHRTGAFYWRWASGTPWQPVPGREQFIRLYPRPKALDE